MPRLSTFITALALLGLPLSALAEEGAAPAPEASEAQAPLQPKSQAKKKRVTATLVTDVDAVVPGATFRVGIHYKLDDHWHIYWHEPGDTGLPTEITFGAPDGWGLGELKWPTPRYFETKTGLKNYGYDDEVLLFTSVRVPDDALEGTSVTLTADSSWLVCKESCIPGSAEVELTLPVRSGEVIPSRWLQKFDAATAALPVAPEGLKVEPVLSVDGVGPGDPFQLVAVVSDVEQQALTVKRVFPAPAEGLKVVSIETVREGDFVPPGGFLIRVEGETSKDETLKGDRLRGVVQLERAGTLLNVAFAAPVPRLAEGVAGKATAHPLFAGSMSAGAAAAEDQPAVTAAPGSQPKKETQSLALMLFFAFLGGIILNVMPCVLPVLSIKVLGLVQQANEDRKVIWNHGLAYSAGILMSFGVLAGILIGIKAGGELAGWGFQFQSPAFVAVLGGIILAFGLSLFGVFEVSMPGASNLDSVAAKRHGYGGSFFNGVFATALATPCTAPFLAPALGYALSQPPLTLTVMLLMVGLGLAFPFLLLAAIPRWAKLLPKPGAWMHTFKQFMGFLLIGTLVWLLHILNQQVSAGAFATYLILLTVIAFACWIYGHWGNAIREARTRWIAAVVSIGMIAFTATNVLSFEPPPDDGAAVVEDNGITWHNFKKVDVETLAAEGHTVFIDFTAAWCATCKVVEETVIDTDAVKKTFDDLDVVVVKADWTRKDEQITKWLKRFNRAGVPMYIVLPAGRPDAPILLPDLPSSEEMIAALRKAGPSKKQLTQAGAKAPGRKG